MLYLFLFFYLSQVKCQTTVQYCGNTPADVVFMLDSSNSMWGPHFIQQLEFVRNVTGMFVIGANETQVGLATFNNEVQLQFFLNEYSNKERLLRAISMIQQSNGQSTATDKAIRFLRTRFFNSRHGARASVPHIAVIITDGQSDNLMRTLIEATKAKREHISIFTVGVGSSVNSLELERMASSPSREYAFIVDNFSFLNSIKEKLAIKTCQVQAPTTTAMPTTSPTTASTIRGTTTVSTTTPTTTTTSTTPTTTLPTTSTTPTTTTTTTTAITTTTIPLPTTTTWIDVVRRICEKKPVDVIFALDSSDVVSAKDLWYQVKFVRDFTLGLDVGFNKTRIGVVIYSDFVIHGFDVNDHTSLSSAIGDLYRITRTYGGTRIDKVIHYVRTKSFRRTVSRRQAAQLLVLITASASDAEYLYDVKKEVSMAKKTGISILTVAIGDKVNPEELDIISGAESSRKNSAADAFAPFLEETSPRRRELFRTDDFSQLDSVVMDATIEACTSEIAPVPVADQACGTRQEADMMFVMDSEGAGKKNTKKSLDFFKHVTSSMEVSQESVQVGMIQPEDCIPPSESFRLNSHTDKDHVMSALDDKADGDKLYSLVRDMRRNAFKRRVGGRKEAKKIAIVLVDGEIEYPLKVLKEARRAQIKGIEVYVIFVGIAAPQPEVRDMCDYPPQKHFFQVPDYDRLKELEDSLIELLCDEL